MNNENDVREEEDEEALFRKVIRTVENCQENLNLFYSGTGMYLLGMSLGWRALRVAHTRETVFNYKKVLVTTHTLIMPYGSYSAA
jgi:hypothetical protein